jgi:hypothetical protein
MEEVAMGRYDLILIAGTLMAAVVWILETRRVRARTSQEKMQAAAERHYHLGEMGKAICREINYGLTAFPRIRDHITITHAVELFSAGEGKRRSMMERVVIVVVFDGPQEELEQPVLPEYIRPTIQRIQKHERTLFVRLEPHIQNSTAPAPAGKLEVVHGSSGSR